jgi:phosphoribosylaminoimidazolecarboxamide formyltransferase/IMP cyclohydrolase
MTIRRALISVSDKEGLVPFAQKLAAMGVELLSTGGTAKALKAAGVAVRDVSDYTGFPEIMDGRVKTLHPKVHGGILARRDEPAHRAAMAQNGIGDIDLVAVNLYPFSETVKGGGDFAECIENIDIGGPAMIRASAKNHEFVTIVTDPRDYDAVLADMTAHKGATTPELRRRLAAKAFALTSVYDSAIAAWFGQPLRYGENPHQSAALYRDGSSRPGVATAKQLQGKELSYNNLNDTDAAFECVAEFDEPAVAIIKHANPCGVAVGADSLEAYKRALACDPVSAFGGIIALNRALDRATAAEIVKIFSEVIIAPAVNEDALEILKTKSNLRVLTTNAMPDPAAARRIVKSIAGGFLAQDADNGRIGESDLKIVTKKKPTAAELRDMLFAFRVAKHVKSNAIVYAKDLATVGVGAGQMSRIDSTRIAARKMGEMKEPPEKVVVASDAFFPFADGLIAAAEAGATAIIQPGGSIRDDDVIKAADERGLAMVFTGMRHFRH